MRSIREKTSREKTTRCAVRLGRQVHLVLLGFNAGCSPELPTPLPSGHSEAALPRRGGALTLASFGDMRTLDPANVADGIAPQVLQAMFAGLVDYDTQGQIQPELAKRYSVSSDGTHYRFVLREGVRFHDGEELTADDVKRSVERALHPTSPNPSSASYASIKGYAAFIARKAEHLDGVSVEGRYVVTFDVDRPDSSFLPLLAMQPLRPVCKSAGTRYADTWHPCGAGPFKLLPGGWDHGRQIKLVRHPGYFRPGLPYLDSFTYLFNVNTTSQRFKFATGEQDVLRDFLAPELLKFQADPRWRPYGEYEIEKQVAGLAMNTELAPFDNVEIRRAVATALDRDQLQQVRASNLRPAYLPVPPGVEGYDASLKGQHFDLNEALDHMKRAGYPFDPATRTGGWPHIIPYLTYTQGLDEYLVQIVMQQLARIGIRLEVRIVNYPTFLALRGRRKQTVAGPGFWQQDYPEPGSFLEPLFHSKSINDEESNNASFYANSRVDELIDRARHELNPERRKKTYGEAQEIICDEAPWAFTHYYRFFVQWQPYVRDYRPHPTWTLDAARVWLDHAAGPLATRALFSGDALAKLLGTRIRGRATW